ncbi:hypothetical protein VNO77_39271 [Canavalia gladiata]|uniref:Gnk2-homologous domain-containing protein n=1 Tax=Canavalia gladiata TaxID=3824 RepID=A0AAN9KDD8_CANGL
MEPTKLNVRSICSFAFLLLLSFEPLVSKAQSPNYVGDDCHNTTEKPLSSTYKTNLNSLFTWLSSDAATSKGYNHNSIGNNTPGDADAVYGLYDCRGDVAGYFCQFCVSTATREVLQRCPNRVSAIVWYDFCILRYSNEDFFGNVTIYPSWHAFGTKNVSNSVEIQKGEDFMKSLIRKATVETNQLFYMDGFNLSSTQKRYGLVQCSRDLTNDGCRQCLEAMLAQVPKCCEQKLGWQVLAASCLIKYDDYIFYLFPTQASSVPVPNMQTAKQGGSGKSRILIIGLSVLVSVALLSFGVLCFWIRNRVRKDGVIPHGTVHLSSYHNVQTEDTLNTDLPTIPLITILKSTDNFSKASKLGEGGFGPVYKGILPDGRQIAVKRLSTASDKTNGVAVVFKVVGSKVEIYCILSAGNNNFYLICISGYMAPEYAMEGLFSVKSDVFSFGVLVLEIISGRKNSGFYLLEFGQSLTLYAWKLWCAGKCLELMDPVVEKSLLENEVVKCIQIGLLCVQEDAADRPTMSSVVVMLNSDSMALPKPNQPAFSVGRMTSEEASTSKSSKNLSINDVTVSNILPR